MAKLRDFHLDVDVCAFVGWVKSNTQPNISNGLWYCVIWRLSSISSGSSTKNVSKCRKYRWKSTILLKEKSTNLATTKAMHWGTKWFNFILSVTNELIITLPTWINEHRLEHFLFVPWPQLKIMCTDGNMGCFCAMTIFHRMIIPPCTPYVLFTSPFGHKHSS